MATDTDTSPQLPRPVVIAFAAIVVLAITLLFTPYRASGLRCSNAFSSRNATTTSIDFSPTTTPTGFGEGQVYSAQSPCADGARTRWLAFAGLAFVANAAASAWAVTNRRRRKPTLSA
jgi:hypothetical protein